MSENSSGGQGGEGGGGSSGGRGIPSAAPAAPVASVGPAAADVPAGPSGGGDDIGLLADEIVRRWDPEKLLSSVSSKAGKGESLDYATRARFEQKLGVDLSSVRLYTGEFAQQVTGAHGAEAVTIGNTGMVMMGGNTQFSMASTAGQALLAHELTHVAQSLRGVHAFDSFDGSAPLATEEHEEEAEIMQAAELGHISHEHGHHGGHGGHRGHGGGGGGGGHGGGGDQAKEQEKKEAVLRRVMELFEEEAAVALMRTGSMFWRP